MTPPCGEDQRNYSAPSYRVVTRPPSAANCGSRRPPHHRGKHANPRGEVQGDAHQVLPHVLQHKTSACRAREDHGRMLPTSVHPSLQPEPRKHTDTVWTSRGGRIGETDKQQQQHHRRTQRASGRPLTEDLEAMVNGRRWANGVEQMLPSRIAREEMTRRKMLLAIRSWEKSGML
eukprot:CAMPEP_0206597722 /NCGR_PEP_ID=MMETSP0325_2-20121206/44264_1 /ASSEMBLY_ACC=CAM_ASM_000347 /TAXON_ID=2866 /ORGANISM="Crypthecodinium cohnii, Strain Seligo" /LENGTH=174 /DNA_ID=CAMNT_0054108679 /DNA_START=414 /DNA_END=935 /DNA_ORIENTATION=-